MKFHNTMIEKSAAPKDVRNYLHMPYLDVDKQTLTATTGSILSVVPVEIEEGDTSGHVSPDAIKAARKLSGRKGYIQIQANGSLVLDNGQQFQREDLGRFPDIDRVIPDKEKITTVISLDAKLLKDLADSICEPGTSVVKISITDNTSSMLIEQNGESDNFGVIMPCRL